MNIIIWNLKYLVVLHITYNMRKKSKMQWNEMQNIRDISRRVYSHALLDYLLS